MNQELQNFARGKLKTGLASLPADWQNMFKLMYGRDGGKRSVEDAKALSIEDVVNEVPEEKLDWAMQQVERSLAKIAATTP